MPETPKARKAFSDYYALGPGRSLKKLFEQYRAAPKGSVPTQRLATINKWSSKWGWQQRVLARDLEIEKAQLEALKDRALQTGYAVYYKRIHDLSLMAEKLFGEIMEDGRGWLQDVNQARSRW